MRAISSMSVASVEGRRIGFANHCGAVFGGTIYVVIREQVSKRIDVVRRNGFQSQCFDKGMAQRPQI